MTTPITMPAIAPEESLLLSVCTFVGAMFEVEWVRDGLGWIR